MFKQKIIFTLFVLYSSFLISEDDNVEVDLLFLKIQELEIEIAELRNILESQNYLIQKLIQESASDDIEDKENTNNIISDNIVRFAGIDDTRSKEEVYETAIQSLQDQDFEKAISLFKFFVDNFKDEEKLPLSLFWLGEVALIQNNLIS
jgi:TolA-binding protein